MRKPITFAASVIQASMIAASRWYRNGIRLSPFRQPIVRPTTHRTVPRPP